jgi:hypothetical protein
MIRERRIIMEEIPIIFTDGLIQSIINIEKQSKTEYICTSCNETTCKFSVNIILKNISATQCPLNMPIKPEWRRI